MKEAHVAYKAGALVSERLISQAASPQILLLNICSSKLLNQASYSLLNYMQVAKEQQMEP